MNNTEVISDFRRRYQHTYVFLRTEAQGNEESLVYVDSVEDSEDYLGVLHLSSMDYGKISINAGSPGHELIFRLPEMGCFQYKGDALTVARNPVRQFRRGVCTDNTEIHYCDVYLTSRSLSFRPEIIEASFNKQTYSFKEALQMLCNKQVRSVALKKNFCVSLSLVREPLLILYYLSYPIAYLSMEGKVSVVMEKNFTREINTLVSGGFDANNH